MSYKVKLNIFEGPFDLLVYLIENARMNIYDIQVSEITAQYLKYVDRMQRLDISLSSEFMVLAASLIDIKSKMLLPRISEDGEDLEAEDPRTELVQKLLEYKRFKRASEILADGEARDKRIFEKPQEDISEFTDEPDEYLSLGIEQFVKAFNNFLTKKKKLEEIRRNYERIKKQRTTTEERMSYITEIFTGDRNKTVTFDQTVQNAGDKYDIVLSFSSVLEMIKQQRIIAEQARLYGEIALRAGENIEKEIIMEEE